MTRMMDAPAGTPAETLFRGGGEMAALARELDWSSTPVGPVESWSASLRSIVSTLLASRHPMFLWWGPELTQFYNDAYRQSLGPDRHPAALGARGRECWAEIWPIIGPEVDDIMANGAATWHEDHLVPITRGDRVHDVYWSYSYSPVQDDDGSVGGVLVTVQETTRRVVGERRARLLQTLATELLQARSVDDVCTASVAALSRGPDDVACVLLYLLDDAAGVLRYCGGLGVRPGAEAAPRELSPGSDAPWPVASALAAAGTAPGGIDSAPVSGIQCERWPEPISEAVTTAIAAAPSAIPAARAHPAHGVV
ncbi:MAG TPA: PAS domain-containing protein, partial [Gemmatimonadales bacterium]|nr:PAS domain-containing protein [Gemmatimonadales bacterium]